MQEVVGKVPGHNPCSHYDNVVCQLEVVTEIPGQKEGGLRCKKCGGVWPWFLVAEKLHVQQVGPKTPLEQKLANLQDFIKAPAIKKPKTRR